MLKLKRLLSRKQSNGESKKKPTGAAAPTAGAGAPATTAAPEPVAAMPASPAMHALSRLDEVEGALSRRNDLLQLRVAAELARARALAQQGNKRGALAALRRKRMYEAQLGAVETQQLRLSEQQVGLEGVHAAAQAAASLRLSAAAGAASLGQLSSEEVGDLVEGAAEAAHAAAELQAVLGAPLGASVDEEELAAELAELEAAQLEEDAALQEAALAGKAQPAPLPQQQQPAVVDLHLPNTPTARPKPPARMQSQREEGEGREAVSA